MDSIRRRTDGIKESSSEDYHDVALSKSPRNDREKSPHGFDYKNDLLLAISLPICAFLTFGGRLSVLAICFGGLMSYIFDLLGSVEGSLICVMMTTMGLFASLIWASRTFLSQSVYNFSLVVIIGIVLFDAFAILASHYTSVLAEFQEVYMSLEVLLFASLPMISSAILSWLICIEMPAFELDLCFCALYFLYALYLCHPRYTSDHFKSKKKSHSESRLLLPFPVVRIVYLIPLAVTPAIHIALHRNVIATSHTRLIGLLNSILLPAFLMAFCARKQVVMYLPKDMQHNHFSLKVLDVAKFLIGLFLLLIAQNHPMFDEIKSFSGLSEPYPTFLFIASLTLAYGAYLVYSYTRTGALMDSEESEYLSVYNKSSRYNSASILRAQMLKTLVSVCIGLCTLLLSILVNIPALLLPVCVIGSVTITEFYHRKELPLLMQLLLVFITVIALFITAIAFSKNTLYYLEYSFRWHIDLDMQQLCGLFAVLLALSVGFPTLVLRSTIVDTKDSSNISLLPNNVSKSGSVHLIPGLRVTARVTDSSMMNERIFEFLLPVVSLILASLELMIREQDWSGVGVSVETIYPTYYLLGTGLLMFITSYALFSAGVIGVSALWMQATIQLCKCLHIIGIPSAGVFITGGIILAYTLPFVRHISVNLQAEAMSSVSGAINSAHYTLSNAEILIYILVGSFCTYWARFHGMHIFLQYLFQRDTSDLQEIAASFGIWFAYISCILLIFYRKFRILRRFSLLLSVTATLSFFFFLNSLFYLLFSFDSLVLVSTVVCVVLAGDALGSLLFTYDPDSILMFKLQTNPDATISVDHSAFFQIFSMVLTLIIYIGLVPIRNPISLVICSFVYSFITAKALFYFAYPLSMATDEYFSHHIFRYPFNYLFSAVMGASIAVFGECNQYPVLVTHCIIVTGGLVLPLIAMFYEMTYHAMAGAVLSAIIVASGTAVCTRACEVTNYVQRVQGVSPRNTGQQLSLAVFIATTIGFFWSVVYTVLCHHNVDVDLTVPFASLLFITTSTTLNPFDNHPVMISVVISAVWWMLSAGYSLFLKDLYEISALKGFQHSFAIFPDHNVSFWSRDEEHSILFSFINLGLLLIPFPGILLSALRRRGDSEEVLFVLAVLSALSVVGAHLNSIRYLGLLGAIASAWRCYDIGKRRQQSNRLI